MSQAVDIRVVGVASNGRQAVRLVLEVDPDVVIMDLNMPGLDGLQATQQLTSRGPRPRVLVLTMYEDDETILAALKAGAGGYLLKGADPEHVVETILAALKAGAGGYLLKGADPEHVVNAVRAVASGHAVCGPAVAARMLRDLSPARRPQLREEFPELSAREREVLGYLAEGMTNKEIAEIHYLSPITVRNHVSSILTKLQLPNRRQAMIRARKAGAAPGW